MALAVPTIGLLWDRSWLGLELFGSAPDSTTLATLGLMLLIRHRLRPLLLMMPLAWGLLSGLTLLTLADPAWPLLPILALWQWRSDLGHAT